MCTTCRPRPTRPRRRQLQRTVNNLIKRVKRLAFGFKRFGNYRVRTLLYAGKPNWDPLPTITPR